MPNKEQQSVILRVGLAVTFFFGGLATILWAITYVMNPDPFVAQASLSIGSWTLGWFMFGVFVLWYTWDKEFFPCKKRKP